MPNETPQDAQVDSSPADQIQETQINSESQGADSSQAEDAQLPSSQQQDANKGADGGKGIPQQNIYGEMRRKILEEITPIISTTVREVMLGSQQHQANVPGSAPQTAQKEEAKYRGYTQSQLETIMSHPDATEQDRTFALRGLSVLEAKQETMKEFESQSQRVQAQSRSQAALQEIIRDYPQLYNATTNQWNFQDPLFQKAMQLYNAEPRLQQFGNEGLRVAVDRTFAQMARDGKLALSKKEVKLTAKEAKLDKQQSQAITSGTQMASSQNKSNQAQLSKLMEAYHQASDVDTKSQLRTQIFKMKGLIPDLSPR